MSADIRNRLRTAAGDTSPRRDFGDIWSRSRSLRIRRATVAGLMALLLMGSGWGAWAALDGRREEALPPVDKRPQGLELVVAAGGALNLIGVDSGDSERLDTVDGDEVFSHGLEMNPMWSSDGDMIAYSLTSNSNAVPSDFEIALTTRSGNRHELLTEGDPQELAASFSPDGSELSILKAFPRGSEIVGSRNSLFVHDLRDGSETSVTSEHDPASTGSWSPDGSSLVYSRSDRAAQAGLYVAEREEDEWTTYPLPTGHAGFDPDWSPTGTHIAFVPAGPAPDVHVLQLDTGRVTPATEGRFAMQPRWTDDGRWIVFAEAAERGLPNRDVSLFAVQASGGRIAKVAGPFQDFEGFDVRGSLERDEDDRVTRIRRALQDEILELDMQITRLRLDISRWLVQAQVERPGRERSLRQRIAEARNRMKGLQERLDELLDRLGGLVGEGSIGGEELEDLSEDILERLREKAKKRQDRRRES